MSTKCPKCHTENPDSKKFCGDCGTPLDADVIPTMTLETPTVELIRGSTFAGRYEIIEELGAGGMGKVYRVEDRKIREEVALKLLKSEISSDNKTIERFSNELKLARKIVHKNVGRMFELLEDRGIHFITMEYVSGQDLKGLIRQSAPISAARTISIAKQICAGLAEAHSVGVIHRDLKPSNIMIDREGNARIMDFGIARSLKTKGMTGTGILIGTPEYMSPEQAEAKEIDQRSDIYSLGVILFEMAAGQLPFRGDTPLSVAMKHKGEKPRDPREINPQIPDDLSVLILKCLEKDKDSRYQSAGEIRSELERIEKGLPSASTIIPPKKPHPTKEITVSFQPKKILIPAMVVIALIVAIFLVFQFLPEKRQQAAATIENSIAVISFENQTGDQKYDYLRKAIPNLIITNLENTSFFYVATWERLFDLLRQMGKKDLEIIDRDLGFDLCRREGIEYIVLGSFTKAGNTFATDVKVLEVKSKNLLNSASSQGDGEDSILKTQIAELSREISGGIGIGRDRIESTSLQVSDVTTSSMEAYNYYLEGKEAYDKFYFAEALENMQKALKIDPEFAMAHLYLGRAQGYLGNRTARDASYTKANELSDKATEKERLYIRSQYERTVRDDWEKGKNLLVELVNQYPKEKQFHFDLGTILGGRGFSEEAAIQYKTALELDPEYGDALNGLAYYFLDKREFDSALHNFEKYAALNPKDANPVDSMAELYLRMGRLDESLAKYKEVLKINPRFGGEWRVAYLYALKEDYDSAFQWLEPVIGQNPFPGMRAEGYLWRGIYNYSLGRIKESFDDIETAKEWAEKAENPFRIFTLYYTEGFMHYELEDPDSASKCFQKSFETFRRLYPESDRAEVFADYLSGLIDLERGNIESANRRLENLDHFLSSSSASPYQNETVNWWKKRLQAKAFRAEGAVDEAIQLFEEVNRRDIPSMRTNNLGPYVIPFARDEAADLLRMKGDLDRAIDVYQRLMIIGPQTNNRRLIYPKYHFKLAQIYEEKGWAGKAIEHYEKFLVLWKDADPGLPEADDARRRMDAIRNH